MHAHVSHPQKESMGDVLLAHDGEHRLQQDSRPEVFVAHLRTRQHVQKTPDEVHQGPRLRKGDRYLERVERHVPAPAARRQFIERFGGERDALGVLLPPEEYACLQAQQRGSQLSRRIAAEAALHA